MIDVKDESKMACLVIPGSQKPRPARTIAPVELGIPSISFNNGSAAQPVLPSSIGVAPDPHAQDLPSDRVHQIHPLTVPLLYASWGVLMLVSFLIFPEQISLAFLLTAPLATLAIIGQSAAFLFTEPYPLPPVLIAAKVLFAYPICAISGHLYFAVFLALTFHVFTTWRFWRAQEGIFFILIVLSWAGVIAAACWSLALERSRVQPAIMTAFAIASAVICTRSPPPITLRVLSK